MDCEIELTVGAIEPVPLSVVSEPIELNVTSSPISLTVSPEPIELAVITQPIALNFAETVQGPPGPQGPAGPSGSGGDVRLALISLQWGDPEQEVANVIEIAGSFQDYQDGALATSIADVKIIVTDGANDVEPSHTAFITAAGTPVGTMLGGSGTATVVIRAASGLIAIAIHESAPNCKRYLWISGAGHEQLWVRAADGVQELSFS